MLFTYTPYRLHLVLLLIHFIAFESTAQSDYTPRKTYSDNSRSLIAELNDQLDNEVKDIQPPNKSLITKIYSERTGLLIRQVKRKAFIDDDSLQQLVDVVMKQIVAFNTIQHQPKRILILKSQEVNAFCYGEGSIIITVGLLSRIENENQLAFAIAHEIAHYELDHVKTKIIRAVEKNFEKRTRQEVSKILTDEVTLEDIESLKQLIYGESEFSREAEIEADSLGFIYFTKAKYKPSEAIALLSFLKNNQDEKIGETLFTPFNSGKYPFQKYWIKSRLSIYHKKSTNSFVFSNDSIQSHPDIEVRKAHLKPKIETVKEDVINNDRVVNGNLHYTMQMESVESSYFNKQYDHCIYLSLKLWNKYPHNTYLICTISKIMIELIEAKSDNTFGNYVSLYTTYYEDDLRLVNNFLYNINEKEMGEVAFNFLNNKNNFSTDKEEQYYLLWKICGLTQRYEVQKKITASYKERFGKDAKYSSKMN